MVRPGALLARLVRSFALLLALTLAGGFAVLPAAPGALRLSPPPSAGVGQVTAIGGPARRFAADSRAMALAQTIARTYWDRNACGGHVALEWTRLMPTTNARSMWRNPVGPYAAPARNIDCRIEFNSRAAFDWPKFCTVVVHEYGHLTGHPHTPNPADVMSAIYSTPVPECAQAHNPLLAVKSRKSR